MIVGKAAEEPEQVADVNGKKKQERLY